VTAQEVEEGEEEHQSWRQQNASLYFVFKLANQNFDVDISYWHSLSLVNQGWYKEAVPYLKAVLKCPEQLCE